ncbi:UNVERIFIED_CONTAM: hypothetical protein FKN15_012131 [Acipenser sinensis]
MDVSISVSFFQDELASTIEHAVKAAVDTVLCEITKVVGGKFTEFQMEMAGKEKENESLKLRLEISESELKAVRECMNAADADIKQPLRNINPDWKEQDFQRIENQGLFQDPKESHAILKSEAQEGPRIEAVYPQEESFDQEWCASLKQVTELKFVKDEEVPRLECVPIKEEFIEQECVPIAEEVLTENNVGTLEENKKLGSSLCDDCPSECELGFRGFRYTSLKLKPVKMDVSVSVSFFQDELASTIEHAVKAAVDTVLCEITKVVGSKFTEFQMEMSGKEKENESLKLRLEISESELKAARECMNAADADIKQHLRNMNPDCNEQDFQRNENQGLFQDPKERHAMSKSEAQKRPRIEAVYTQEESFDQEWCASLKQVTELTCVQDEEVPRLECVPIKEEFIEQECAPITEEVPTEINVFTLEENHKLGSSLYDDCSPECELGFRGGLEGGSVHIPVSSRRGREPATGDTNGVAGETGAQASDWVVATAGSGSGSSNPCSGSGNTGHSGCDNAGSDEGHYSSGNAGSDTGTLARGTPAGAVALGTPAGEAMLGTLAWAVMLSAVRGTPALATPVAAMLAAVEGTVVVEMLAVVQGTLAVTPMPASRNSCSSPSSSFGQVATPLHPEGGRTLYSAQALHR